MGSEVNMNLRQYIYELKRAKKEINERIKYYEESLNKDQPYINIDEFTCELANLCGSYDELVEKYMN